MPCFHGEVVREVEQYLSILGGGSRGRTEGAGRLAPCVHAQWTQTLRNADRERDAPPSISPFKNTPAGLALLPFQVRTIPEDGSPSGVR